MENIEREKPESLYDERDIRCIEALVGNDSYLYRLAAAQKPELIPELSSFLTTSRLMTILVETIDERLHETADISKDREALQIVVSHLILLCERLSGEKLVFSEN